MVFWRWRCSVLSDFNGIIKVGWLVCWNRHCNAALKLRWKAANSGWLGGASATACSIDAIAWSRSFMHRVLSNRARKAVPKTSSRSGSLGWTNGVAETHRFAVIIVMSWSSIDPRWARQSTNLPTEVAILTSIATNSSKFLGWYTVI